MLLSVKPPDSLTVAVAVVLPVSEPPPVQPLTVNVLPEAVADRLAVAIPLRPRLIPSVEDSAVLDRVKLEALLAATMPAPAGAVSDPVPVQPLTVNVSAVALEPVRAATAIPLRLSVKVDEGAGQLGFGQGVAR